MHQMFVVCAGNEKNRFDRDYYADTHLALALKCWKPYGLISAEAFFPATNRSGWLSIGVYTFESQQDVIRALESKETGRVMADVPHFTDASTVIRSHFMPF
ncbi:EthD family reductase [Erwinia sp. MMLR14_017]|uniref:EthD family reductase n=1 Tax=Erwinia sp. MMLR14_017 TaxID=3093842 RepID=UPI00298FB2C0|nr:EthD family reductase [Erwinia sp. MMLR14_017]MDW8844564.1 EthD family reductase [Erwinia sp. MMLR14_017]